MPISNDPRSGETSHIGKSIHFNGNISGNEDVYIDGNVEGVIRLSGQVVTVGPHGQVSAEIEARELIIHGRLKGNAKAQDRIELTRTGSVEGDLAMARISIQDGAFIQGRVDIQAANALRAASTAAAQSPAETQPPAAPPAPPMVTVPAPAAPRAEPIQSSLLDRKP